MTDVSQAVNEHLVTENQALRAENKELRDTVAFARDQWKLMQNIVARLEVMDSRLKSIERNTMDDPDLDRLRRIKADRISSNAPFS